MRLLRRVGQYDLDRFFRMTIQQVVGFCSLRDRVTLGDQTPWPDGAQHFPGDFEAPGFAPAPQQFRGDRADLAFELSGAPQALDQLIGLTGFDGRVIIGSWYGTKRADLDQFIGIGVEVAGMWLKSEDQAQKTESEAVLAIFGI